MNAVKKYELRGLDCHTYAATMPRSAIVLSAQIYGYKVQGYAICVWAIIGEPDGNDTERKFLIVADGLPFEGEKMKYIAMAQWGEFTCHVFEVLQ